MLNACGNAESSAQYVDSSASTGAVALLLFVSAERGLEQKSVFPAAAFSGTPHMAGVLTNSDCTVVTASPRGGGWNAGEPWAVFKVGEALHGSDGSGGRGSS